MPQTPELKPCDADMMYSTTGDKPMHQLLVARNYQGWGNAVRGVTTVFPFAAVKFNKLDSPLTS